MKTVVAFCAVLVCVGYEAASPAQARSKLAATLFNEVAPRPPASIPHVQPAVAPLPRPKPVEATHGAPAAAAVAPSGPIVFPPVAPLE